MMKHKHYSRTQMLNKIRDCLLLMFTDGHSPFPMRKTSTSSEATPPPQPPPVTIPEEQQVPNVAAVAIEVSQEESQGGTGKVLADQFQDGAAQQSLGERDREQPPSLENGGQVQITNSQQDSKQGTYQEQLNGDTTVPSS